MYVCVIILYNSHSQLQLYFFNSLKMCKSILSQGVGTMLGYEATWDECDDILNCSMFLWWVDSNCCLCSLIACQLQLLPVMLALNCSCFIQARTGPSLYIMCQQWSSAILQVYSASSILGYPKFDYPNPELAKACYKFLWILQGGGHLM